MTRINQSVYVGFSMILKNNGFCTLIVDCRLIIKDESALIVYISIRLNNVRWNMQQMGSDISHHTLG